MDSLILKPCYYRVGVLSSEEIENFEGTALYKRLVNNIAKSLISAGCVIRSDHYRDYESGWYKYHLFVRAMQKERVLPGNFKEVVT